MRPAVVAEFLTQEIKKEDWRIWRPKPDGGVEFIDRDKIKKLLKDRLERAADVLE